MVTPSTTSSSCSSAVCTPILAGSAWLGVSGHRHSLGEIDAPLRGESRPQHRLSRHGRPCSCSAHSWASVARRTSCGRSRPGDGHAGGRPPATTAHGDQGGHLGERARLEQSFKRYDRRRWAKVRAERQALLETLDSRSEDRTAAAQGRPRRSWSSPRSCPQAACSRASDFAHEINNPPRGAILDLREAR